MAAAYHVTATGKAAVTSAFSIFYSHPIYGCRSYNVASISAQQVGEDAADMLPEDMCEDEEPDDLDLDTIRDDLEIRVYAGHLDAEPTGQKPDWVFE